MPTKVTILSQDFTKTPKGFIESWDLQRKPTLEYHTKTEPDKATEEAFSLLNMPPELLYKEDLIKTKGFRGPSLSIGDVVQTEKEGKILHFLCTNTGWEKKEINKPLPGAAKEEKLPPQQVLPAIPEPNLSPNDNKENKDEPKMPLPQSKGSRTNLSEKEKKKLIKEVRTLLNDFSGPELALFGSINFELPNKLIKDFLLNIQDADSPEEKRKLLQKLGRDHGREKTFPHPRKEYEKKQKAGLMPTRPSPSFSFSWFTTKLKNHKVFIQNKLQEAVPNKKA